MPNGRLWRIFLILSVLFLVACQERSASNVPAEVAMPEHPANSPSGKFVLVVRSQELDGHPAQSFQILDTNQNVLYTSEDHFSSRDTTYFLWDSADRVWVYSGDLGTFFWEQKGAPDVWEKFVYAENDVPAPQFLKEARPRWHQK